MVVGASAGGVDALGRVLPALEPGLPASVSVVVHVPPDRPSLLAELFGAKCRIPVKEAEDKEPLERAWVYFAPPDYHLLIERDRTLSLCADAPVNFSRPSIDVLFESAAWAFGERLLAIVLTGASADGAAGLATVCRFGGLGWVQASWQAQVSTMPDAAAAACPAHETMTLEEMAEVLAAWRTDSEEAQV